MKWSTRLYCTVQQFCAFIPIMGPFFYLSAHWVNMHGFTPSPGSIWDIMYLSLVFLGLLMLLDNVCSILNNLFKNS